MGGKGVRPRHCCPAFTHSSRPAASHAVDFDPPLYNVWKQQEKTQGSSHYGNSEVRWMDNLHHELIDGWHR
jgi:hypothetical protein